ncbi:MAG TPA: Tad domain-containing protein [Acidimicrobiales bacterium]|nr:Tad domain-containing protein [Acidimicrobiales bacterium]
MTRAVRRGEEGERGVVLIIVAVAMVVLLGLIAIAIDGSFGFVQNRRAQNATDFAAYAAAQQLNASTYCNGTTALTMQQVTALIQKLISDNDSGIGTSWTAQYVSSSGTVIPNSTFTPTSSDTPEPPPGSCGVTVAATQTWSPFFAGVLGIHQLGGYASSKVSNTATGQPFSIIALNKVGPHEILGGGTGTFVVSGDIVLNTNVTNLPWTGSTPGYTWDDAIDAKTDSNLYVYGTIHSIGTLNGQNLWPLDSCFVNNGVQGLLNPPAPGSTNPPTSPAYQSGDPAAQLPANTMICSGSPVTVDYNNIEPVSTQITDPLASTEAPPSPLNQTTNIACPGNAVPTVYSNISGVLSGTQNLSPGIYPNPVELTGSATFADCAGPDGGYPGIYVFKGGLWINPQSAGDTVTGSNVVIATGTPYPVAGNVPGSVDGQGVFTASGAGNGAPCLPSGTKTSTASGWGSNVAQTSSAASAVCGGTNSTEYGVLAYHDSPVSSTPDSSMTGTGSNFSLMIGGVAGTAVTLSGATSGAFGGVGGTSGLALYQDPTQQANYGFDATTGDSAAIKVDGVVYNASLTNYGANAPQDYWDGPGGGIPFYAGGTLQTGFGAGWPATMGPAQSNGSFTLNGTAIVDDFNTDGATTITILGQPYALPGGSSLSLIG